MQIRPLSAIKKVILHCSDTPDTRDSVNIAWIRKIHREERGFDDVGYHFLILRNGTVEVGRPIEYVGAHCRDENFDSIGVCLVGRSEYSPAQWEAVRRLAERFREEFCIQTMQWYTHNHFNKHKLCPGFSNEKLRESWEVTVA